MSKIERLIIIFLIMTGLTGICVSYYKKVSVGRVSMTGYDVSREFTDAKKTIEARRTVNINTADAAALCRLPGIGPAIAARIIEYRRVNGAFTSPDELLDVKGIGPAKYEAIKPYISVKD